MTGPRRRTALVAGGAGSIGRAIAVRLAADGVRVFAADLSAERLGEVSAATAGIETLAADLSSPAGVESVLAAVDGPIDIMCNSVGVSDGGASVEELTDELWERVLRINLTSTYLLCNRVVPRMISSGGGVIINVASVAGLRGGRAGAAYTASKWATVGLTENIAASVNGEGVRAHAICPSRIQGAVAMGHGVVRTAKGAFRAERDTGRPPAGRPEDVAELAVFLASDAAVHLNGCAIPLDAGWLAF